MKKINTQLLLLHGFMVAIFLLGIHPPAFAQWQQIYAPKTLDVQINKYQGAYLNLTTDGLYRSDNQGATWEAQPALLIGTDGFTINPFNNKWYKIAGGIYESLNEGVSWTNLNYPGQVNKVQFSRDTVFIRAENNFKLLKYVGGSWQSIIQNADDQISSFCIKDNILFVAYYSNGLYRSTNYGQTWQEIFFFNYDYSEITAKGDTLIYFFYSPNKVYRSYNFGANWDAANIPNTIHMQQIRIQDGLYWGTSGSPSQIYYSPDGLANWQALPLPPGIDGGIYLYQDGDFILMSTNSGAFRSLDLGQTWEASNNIVGLSPGYDLSFLDGNIMTGCFSYLKEGDNVWTTPLPMQCRAGMVKWNNQYLSSTVTSNASIGFEQWHATQSTIPVNPYIINGILSCEYDDLIQQSFDDGATWQPTIVKKPTFSHLPIVGHGNRLWAAGGANDVAVFRYDTVGQNWPHDALWEIGHNCSFINFKDTLYLLTQGGAVQYSPDGGQSIITANKPADYVSSGATGRELFVKDNLMVITTLQGKFYVSKDRGQSWVKLPDPPYGGVNFFTNTPVVGEHFVYTSTDKSIFAYPLDSIQLNKGIVFFDQNSNGIHEPNESGIENIKVLNTGSGQITFTGKQGDFGLSGNKTQDSLQVIELPAGFVVQPASLVFQEVSTPVFFAVQPNANFNDLAINLINAKPFRPGFETLLTGWVKNLVTNFVDAQATITLPTDLQIVSSSPSNAVQQGNTITWTLDQFSPLDVFNFEIIVKTDLLTPAGAPIQIVAETPFPTDAHAADNTYYLQETVVSSYDPNDKVVSPEKISPPELTNAPLTYTIRFQNTGNAATEFVFLQDTISPLLDLSTLQVVASSHPVRVKFKAERLVEFIFSPLSLLPESESESGSQGFVRFTIRALPNLQIGEVVANTAYIYFDYNQPVITNTVGTEIKAVQTVSVETLPIEIAPNPTKLSAILKVPVPKSASGILYLYNPMGQQVLQQTTLDNQCIVSVQAFPAGIYTIHWKIAGRVFVGKLVVEH